MFRKQAASNLEHASNDAGFSLFESVVALGVFALAVVSGLSLITQNTYSASQIEIRTFAGFVAENVLVETRLLDQVTLGDSEGEEAMGGYDFEWSRQIAETGEGDLRSVVVRVRLKGDSQVLSNRNGFQRDAS